MICICCCSVAKLCPTLWPQAPLFSAISQSLLLIELLMLSDHLIQFKKIVRFSLVQSLSCVWLFVTPCTAAHQASLPFTTPGAYSNSCPLSWWCHPTISSSVVPFCFQSFPASESFQMSQLFPSGGQSSGVSASASVLPMNIQDWFPLWWTGWISLVS